MRLYYLTNRHWGLVVLREKRLKFSRFEDLNDPFELLSAHLGEKDARRFYGALSSAVSDRFGLICFSETWQSPVMWAHYADKHKGLCLGFDVKEAAKVSYEPKRLKRAIDAAQSGVRNVVDLTKPAMTTKFEEWSYEKEWRVFADLVSREPDANGHYFHPFDDFVALREVLIGARCDLAPSEVAALLDSPSKSVVIRKVRPSFQEFTMVRQRQVPQLIVDGTKSNR